MPKFDWRIALLLCLDLAVVILAGRTLYLELSNHGPRVLRFYTQDSNLLGAAVCAILAVCEGFCLITGRALPGWTRLLRFLPACCLTVTMLVSACVLAPAGDGFAAFMLKGSYLYLHTLCPLLVLLSFLLHPGAPMGAGHALLPLIPTVVYAAITLWRTAAGLDSAPYFFFRVQTQAWYVSALWMGALLGGNYLIAWGLTGLRQLAQHIFPS